MLKKLLKNKYLTSGLILLVFLVIFFNQQLFSNRTLVPLGILKEFDLVLKTADYQSQNYLLSDLITQFHPNYNFIHQSINSGQLPFWNPYILAGTPFLADSQTGFLEFTHLISYLLNISPLTFPLTSGLILLFLLGMSFFIYLDNLKFDFLVAIFGAVVLMFSGTVVVWLNYPLLAAFVWLPLILLCLDKITRDKNRKFLPLLSIIIVFLLFAGYPQIALINLIIGAFYFLVRAKQYKTLTIKIISLTALFVTFGLGISMIQLGPSWDFIKKSESYEVGRGQIRNDNNTETLITQFSNIKQILLELAEKTATYGKLAFYPNYYGSPVERNYQNPASSPYANYSEVTIYAGLLTILLALMSFVWLKKEKILAFWLLSGIISFSLFTNLPLLNLLKYLPLINKISLSRFRLLFIFSVVILATYTLQKIFNFTVKKKIKLARPIIVILIVVSFGELFYFFHDYNLGSVKDTNFITQNKAFEFLQNNTGNERILGLGIPSDGFRTALLPNTSALLGLYDVRGYNPIVDKKYTELAETYLTRRGSFILDDAIFDEKIIDLLSIKYIICPQDKCLIIKGSETWPKQYQDDNISIFENPNFLPRSYIAYDYLKTAEDQEIQELGSANFNPYSQVIISDSTSIVGVKRQIKQPVAQAEILEYSPNKVIIKAQSATSGVLVLTDTFAEGWQATIDNKQAEIFLVNGIFRGVVIPSGENTVVFSYLPKYFYTYLAITIFSLLLLITSSIYIVRKNKL